MKAQINMIFTFIVALIIIAVIVLVATKLLDGTFKDKCTADVIVFSDSFKETIRTNNDYGGITQESYLAPCNYRTICLVDAKVLSDSTFNGNFKYDATGFPGAEFIRDSVIVSSGDTEEAVKENIFLIDNDGVVTPAGFAPQLQLYNPRNASCFSAKQGKFTFILRGQGRTTLINAT